MDKRKLLIADNSEELPMALAEMLSEEFDIRWCMDGKEALGLIQSFHPDVLVLEPMIPSLDGISLLQAASAAGEHPLVLVITKFYNDYMMEAVTRLGAVYVMIKPCDIQATVARIRDMSQLLSDAVLIPPDPRPMAAEIMLRLGLTTKHQGYACLREAIALMVSNPRQSITKELYPAVAALLNSSQKNVEHLMRTAIYFAWSRRDDSVWQNYFPAGPDGTVLRPCNSAFISRIAEAIRDHK